MTGADAVLTGALLDDAANFSPGNAPISQAVPRSAVKR
jgi:hypothetical protein